MADINQENQHNLAQNRPYWTPQFRPGTSWQGLYNASNVGELASAERASSALDSLSIILQCEKKYTLDQISSIPDVWAKPVFFEQMLFYQGQREEGVQEEEDPEFKQLREQAVLQWRALLCIAAMSGRFPKLKDVDSVTVALPPVSQHNIISVLRDMPPENCQIWKNFGWDEITLILAGSVEHNPAPIVLCNPATLVSPAADCWDILVEAVPFIRLPDVGNDIQFYDPAGTDADGKRMLTPEQAVFMKTWLIWMDNLVVDNNREIAANGEALKHRGSLHTLLTEFRDALACQPYPSLAGMPIVSSEQSMAGAILFSKLKAPLDPSELIICDDRDGVKVLADPDIANPSLATQLFCQAYRADKSSTAAQLAGRRITFVEKQDIFLDKITYVNTFGSQTPYIDDSAKTTPKGSTKDEQIVVFLPISEKLSKDVQDASFQLDYDKNVQTRLNGIYIKCNVRLQSGELCPVSKYYKADQIVTFDYHHQNTSAIWPNRHFDGWNVYYLYSNAWSVDPRYVLAPFADNINTEARYSFGGDANTVNNDRKRMLRYYSMKDYPKMLRCLDLDDRYLGMLPVVEHSGGIPNQGAAVFTASMDYGTSSSIIYVKHDAAVAEPIDLRDTVATLFGQEKGGTGYGVIQQYFTPGTEGETIEVPFPTLLYFLNNTENLFLDWHLYFKKNVPDLKNPLESVGSLQSNTKWDSYRRKVMYQMALMSCLQARKRGYANIRWLVSYPISMRNLNYYLDDYQAECQRAMQDAGFLPYGQNMQPTDFTATTESDAAARYFAKQNALNPVMSSYMSVVDIGGGSSDIFVFRNNRGQAVAYEGSIKLGARDLLLDLIKRRPYFLARILKEIHAIRIGNETEGISGRLLDQLYQNRDSDDKYGFYQDVESIFSVQLPIKNAGGDVVGHTTIGQKLSEYVSRSAPQEGQTNQEAINLTKEILLFKTILAVNLMPVFYYTGLFLRYINEHDGAATNKLPTLCIAGNGSNMLKWLGSPRDTTGLIDEMLTAACGETSDFTNIIFSDKFKHEAAIGMTLNAMGVNNNAVQPTCLPLSGEEIGYMDGGQPQTLGELSLLTEHMFEGTLQIPDEAPLKQFRKMIQRFSHYVSGDGGGNNRRMNLFRIEFTDETVPGGIEINKAREVIRMQNSQFNEFANTVLYNYQARIRRAADNNQAIDVRPILIIASDVLKEELSNQWWLQGQNDQRPWNDAGN